jgi:hypothetical protein
VVARPLAFQRTSPETKFAFTRWEEKRFGIAPTTVRRLAIERYVAATRLASGTKSTLPQVTKHDHDACQADLIGKTLPTSPHT